MVAPLVLPGWKTPVQMSRGGRQLRGAAAACTSRFAISRCLGRDRELSSSAVLCLVRGEQGWVRRERKEVTETG